MTPIFFIHRGFSSYLLYTTAQARHSNPDTRIILLGDRHNRWIPNVEHFELPAYMGDAEEFAKVYKHRSDNPFDYELFCFQRWFALREFLRKHNLDCAFYIDSDVMLYSRVSELKPRVAKVDLAVTQQGESCPSGGISFINNLSALTELVGFFGEQYSSPELFKTVEAQYQRTRELGVYGGACDMTSIREFLATTDLTTGSIQSLLAEGDIDENMLSSDGYVMSQAGIKQVTWVNQLPYCTRLSDGELVQMHALHFAGASKYQIPLHFQGSRLRLAPALFRDWGCGLVGRVKQRIVGRKS